MFVFHEDAIAAGITLNDEKLGRKPYKHSYINRVIMRICQAGLLALVMLVCSCSLKHEVDNETFGNLKSTIQGLLAARNLPVDANSVAICLRSSIFSPYVFGSYEFFVIRFDWRDDNKHKYGIRGQNGPYYILWRNKNVYTIVGCFLGSRLDIIEEDGVLVARVYYHMSAAEAPHTDYPFINGKFNERKINQSFK
jgi:hypothetical protein